MMSGASKVSRMTRVRYEGDIFSCSASSAIVPKTSLLHVETSQGRSVFDDLLRVANSEAPVGTAVNTVNGLVVEE